MRYKMRGLVNIGNSCYFNASLQVLLHVPILSNRFIKRQYTGECEFTRLYSRLVNDFWKASDPPREPLDPTPLIRAFQKTFPRFVDEEQHDVQEAVLCIVDILERAVPWIKEIVYGTKTQVTKYPGGESSRDEAFCVHILAHESGSMTSGNCWRRRRTGRPSGLRRRRGTRHHVAATRTFSKQCRKFCSYHSIKEPRARRGAFVDEHR